jgi:serine/threonine protein kinase/tetratricopeptide (TPR) repeat protein
VSTAAQTPSDPDATEFSDGKGGGAAADERPLRRGDTVHRYVVLEELGRGGMGVVYAAYDPELDRRIALKLLKPARKSDESQERLLAEARAMAKLSHQNVIGVHDVGTYSGRIFVAMEFVDGWTIRGWQKETKPSWEQLLEVYVAAGQGLMAAHAAGLVHRDFKPDNIMIGRDGRVRVLDFGLARAIEGAVTPLPSGPQAVLSEDAGLATPSGGISTLTGTPTGSVRSDMTKTGSVMGTPAYMAPEQHLGTDTDERTDEFAFGVSLWEGLYGKRPFKGSTRAALVLNVMDGKVRPPPKDTRVPSHIQRALVRAMQSKANDRFANMAELLDALTDDPVQRRRKRLKLAGGVILFAGAIGVGAMATGPEPDVCADGSDKLVGIWDTPRREAIQNSFAATDLPYAAHTWERVEGVLNEYTAAWQKQYVDACEATHVRHEQSTDLLDRRMSCLDGRLSEVEALVEVLTDADPSVVERAVKASVSLGDVEVCADSEWLLSETILPPDKATAEQVTLLRSRITRANFLGAAARHDEATAAISELSAEVLALDFAPLTAEFHAKSGRVLARAGEGEKAEAELLTGFFGAQASGHDRAALMAATRLVHLTGYTFARFDQAELWERQAKALAERTKAGELDFAALSNHLGAVEYRRGRYAKSIEHWQKTLELFKSVHGPEHPDVATTLNNLGASHERLNKEEEALSLHREALKIRRTVLGPEHPAVAQSLDNIGIIFSSTREYDRAEDYHRQALGIREAALGKTHPDVGNTLNNLGVVLLSKEQPKEAFEVFERSLGIWKTVSADHPDIAAAHLNSCNALADMGRLEEALERCQVGLAQLIDAVGEGHPFVGIGRARLGGVFMEMERYDEALPLIEAAFDSIQKRDSPDPEDVAGRSVALGKVLWDSGRDKKRALELLEPGLHAYERGAADPKDVDKLREWLAEREIRFE